MKKILTLFLIIFALSISVRAYACSPTFPSLWPPSITSTESTEHSGGITWSMGLPFIGDITAYRIYLNGNLVHTISPSITNLLFVPSGHGSYSVNNLKPDTGYTLSVGVVFAIPIGCGITWNMEMKSSAEVTTKPANWDQNNTAKAMKFGAVLNVNSVQEQSKPHAPVLSLTSYGIHHATVSVNISNSYENTNFTQKKYPVNSVTLIARDSCNAGAYSIYGGNAYYSGYKNYDLSPNSFICAEIKIYKEKTVGNRRGRETETIYRFVLNHTTRILKKTFYISNSQNITLTLPEGDVRYVVYAYSTNTNGDSSNISNPLVFISKQGKTITTCGTRRKNHERSQFIK